MNNRASIHHRQRFSNEFNTQFLISIAFDGIFSTVVNVVLPLRNNPQFFFGTSIRQMVKRLDLMP